MSISLLKFQALTVCLFLLDRIEIVCPNRTHQQNDKKLICPDIVTSAVYFP